MSCKHVQYMCKCPRRSPTPRRRYKVCSSLAGDISFAQDPPVGIQWASSRDPVGTCVGIAAGWRERGRLPLGCRANRGRHGRSNTGVRVGESRGRVRNTDQPVLGNARFKQAFAGNPPALYRTNERRERHTEGSPLADTLVIQSYSGIIQ